MSIMQHGITRINLDLHYSVDPHLTLLLHGTPIMGVLKLQLILLSSFLELDYITGEIPGN